MSEGQGTGHRRGCCLFCAILSYASFLLPPSSCRRIAIMLEKA